MTASSPHLPSAPGADTPLLDVVDAAVHFESKPFLSRERTVVRAVDGVSLHVARGETLGLVGESGCGKTTLARAVMALVPLRSGRVVLDGTDISSLSGASLRRARRRFQMVFQDPYSSLDPRKTIGRAVGEPLDIHGIGRPDERTARVREVLGLVGMSATALPKLPHEFSGGQRQRIGIARALALRPDLIVADEPISALDVSIQAQVTNLLRDLQAELGIAYLYIAHDLAVVRYISHRVAVMYLGRLVEEGPTAAIFDRPIHPYTTALLSAVPIPSPRLERQRRRIVMTGDIPSAASPPSGCRFHTRCWLRKRLDDPQECVTVEPQLRQLLPGRRVACHFAERASAVEAPGGSAEATQNPTAALPGPEP